MSIFGNILNKIFHHRPAASKPVGSSQVAPQAPAAAPTPAAQPIPATGQPAPAAPVDVEAVLVEMASLKDGGNWRTSIVDLLKLLDLESSLAARKELADELGVHAGTDGSAEQNIALHKAVMVKLAENGGVVPDSMRS